MAVLCTKESKNNRDMVLNIDRLIVFSRKIKGVPALSNDFVAKFKN